MTLPAVGVVVLNWNDADTTLRCLRSLADTTYSNRRIIVVDNASADGSVQRIASAWGDVDLIVNAANLGFTGGVNVGIRRAVEAGADYVWLLNSDAVTGPDALGALVAAAEADPNIGLVSPVLHDPAQPDRPEFCLARFDPYARTATQTTDPAVARDWQVNHPDQIVLLGTALLIRRTLIETIGMLDPQFFAYVEDVDFSLRCHGAGFTAVALPDVVVLHKFKQPVEAPASTPPYLHYFMTRNYLLLWRKLPRPHLWRRSTLWFIRERLAQIARMQDQPAAIDAVLAGLWDGFRGIGGPYDPRRRIPWLLRRLGGQPKLWLALLDARQPIRKAAR
jgi:GT2 family glycosyltransferase